MKINKEKNFINYWIFLGIPMNSPLSVIKTAYYSKFEEIEKSINNQDNKYKMEDLVTLNNAYLTLSDPYKRYLHNCEIDGEEPGDILDYLEEGENEYDLSIEDNKLFLKWLENKYYQNLNKVNSKQKESEMSVLEEIISGLEQIYNNLEKSINKNQKKYRHL